MHSAYVEGVLNGGGLAGTRIVVNSEGQGLIMRFSSGADDVRHQFNRFTAGGVYRAES